MTKVKLNHIDLGGDLCSAPMNTNLYILVSNLPERGKKDKIYLVKDDTAPEGNVYNEYSFINGAWESLGLHSSSIDVEVPTKLSLLENDSGFMTDSIKALSTRKLSVGNVLEHYKDIDFSITIPTCSYIGIIIYNGDNKVFGRYYTESYSPIIIKQKAGLGTQFIEFGNVAYDSNNDASIPEENGIRDLKDVSIIIESTAGDNYILDELSTIESYEVMPITNLCNSLNEQKADKQDLNKKVDTSSLGTAAYKNVEDLREEIGTLSRKGEIEFRKWYDSEGKTNTLPVDLSSYSKSLLKIGLSLHTDFVNDERSVHIIDENGNLLGSISGITHSKPQSSSYPYEVFATCEKIVEDIYKIEISGLEQHIVTYSDKPIGYVMAGVYSQTSPSISDGGVIIYGNGKILIYA